MRHTLLTIAATLLVTSALLAGEGHVERHLKLALGDPADVLVIEDDDMEPGETRQFFTESGKEVVITRTEEGRTIEIEGKTIEIPENPANFVFSGEEGVRKVIVKEMHTVDGDAHHAFRFHTGDENEGPHVMVLHRGLPSKHLAESGVLDDLDAETRERILDTLREIEPGPDGIQTFGDLGSDVEVIRVETNEERWENETEN